MTQQFDWKYEDNMTVALFGGLYELLDEAKDEVENYDEMISELHSLRQDKHMREFKVNLLKNLDTTITILTI